MLVLGGGATAASTVVAAAELGATVLTIAVRTPEKASGAAGLAATLGLDAAVTTLDAVDGLAADVVVSTLPGGTELPRVPRRAIDDGALLLDAAYAPWPGSLVPLWSEGGAPIVHGLSMLVHQAAHQVRLFLGIGAEAWEEDAERVTAALFAVVGLDRSGRVAHS